MSANLKTIHQDLPLHNYVADAVEQSADTESASALLEKWALSNDSLYMLLTGPYLSQSCHESVRLKFQMKRAGIWNQDQHGKRVLLHANLLMDFPLIGGGSLRLANKASVLETATFYEKQATDMKSKAIWLHAIAKRLGGKTVEQVFTEKRLRKLQKDLSHG